VVLHIAASFESVYGVLYEFDGGYVYPMVHTVQMSGNSVKDVIEDILKLLNETERAVNTVIVTVRFDQVFLKVLLAALRQIEPKLAVSLEDQLLEGLKTFEHVIVHKWFHTDIVGIVGEHITDCEHDFGGGVLPLYGARCCYLYAWTNVSTLALPGVNSRTVANADSYAWFLTNSWFAERWSWNACDDCHGLDNANVASTDDPPLLLEDPNGGQFTTDSSPEASSSFPPNCQAVGGGRSKGVHCAYKYGTPDEWLANLYEPLPTLGGCMLA
jgi:hypothetical protein